MSRIFSTLKALPLWKSPLRELRTQATGCEVIFAIRISHKRLLSKEHSHLSKKTIMLQAKASPKKYTNDQ